MIRSRRLNGHLLDRRDRELRFPCSGRGKQSPAVLESISQYSPVVIVIGLAAILFMIGNVLFGLAMIRIATLPRWSGVLIAVGAPAHLIGFGVSQLVSTAAWSIAILGSASLGAGLAPGTSDHLSGRCHAGRRDYPSLPAQLRCHPRSWRDPADRLPVLARRQDVSILVGWCFARAGGRATPSMRHSR